jgi:hypothetical protein
MGKISQCGANLPLTAQEASVTCEKCDRSFNFCNHCKKNGCPNCGGKLKSLTDWAYENNILF